MGNISDGDSRGFLDGPAEQWVDELTALVVERGMDTFIFAPSANPAGQLERFAHEVAPQVRERVASERGRGRG
jgi:hypothetical protein